MDKKENRLKNNTKPVRTVRVGAIAANIWQRQSQTGFPYFEYSLSRSWKSSAKGKEGYSQNFFDNNKDAIIQVVSQATDWIANKMIDEETEREASDTNQPAKEDLPQQAA